MACLACALACAERRGVSGVIGGADVGSMASPDALRPAIVANAADVRRGLGRGEAVVVWRDGGSGAGDLFVSLQCD